jgi:hypothetical protein
LLEIELIRPVSDERGGQASGSGLLAVAAGSDLSALVQAAFRQLSHDYFWFVTEAVSLAPESWRFAACTLACKPGRLLAASLDPGAAGGAEALLRAVFQAGHFPLSALFIPAQPLREAVLGGVLGRCAADGALLGALALACPDVSLMSLPGGIALADGASAAGQPNPAAYGKDADWEYVERLGLFDAIAARGNLSIWALAAAAALAEPPSAMVRWAQDIELVLKAGRQVLSKPGSYLKRGLALAFHYLIRGDIQGLIREARLFRPR